MTRRTAVTGIFNLLLKVTCHHVHCTLLGRSKSLGPVYTRGEGIAQKHEYWEVGMEVHSSFSHFRGFSHHDSGLSCTKFLTVADVHSARVTHYEASVQNMLSLLF